MNTKGWIVAVCMVAISCSSGCSLISSKLGMNFFGKAETPSVAVTPWLAHSVHVPLKANTSTLSELLNRPEVGGHRGLLTVVNEALKSSSDPAKPNFNDNCIVLVRGNDYWYFLEPTNLIELYAGKISLRSSDRVMTMPFEVSKFAATKPQARFEYLLLELGQAPRAVPVDPKGISGPISSLQEEPSMSWWTVSVITRVEGSSFHHLVLPANLGIDSLAEPLTFSNKIDRASFQPGDIVEKTNFAQLAARF